MVDESGSVDCQLDASSSSGVVTQYFWTFVLGQNQLTLNRADSMAVPDTNCSFLNNAGAARDDGSLPLEIRLQLRGRNDALSATVTRSVRLFPNGNCGY